MINSSDPNVNFFNSVPKEHTNYFSAADILKNRVFSGVYDVAFAKQKIKNKNKTLNSFWITKGLQSSSKRKQKLYKKFLKKINKISEKRYKTYKTLFKTLRKKSKRSHYSNLTDKYKCNIKKTWVVMKEIIGKSKFKIKKLPYRIVFDEKEIIDDKTLRNN